MAVPKHKRYKQVVRSRRFYQKSKLLINKNLMFSKFRNYLSNFFNLIFLIKNIDNNFFILFKLINHKNNVAISFENKYNLSFKLVRRISSYVIVNNLNNYLTINLRKNKL